MLGGVLYSMIYVFQILLASSLLFVFLILTKMLSSSYIDKDFQQLVDNLNTKYTTRLRTKELEELYEGEVEQKTFISKLDSLLELSNLRQKFKFLTSEVYLMIVGLSAVGIAILTQILFNFAILTIASSCSVILLFYVFLRGMNRVALNSIDDQCLLFTNTLLNMFKTDTEFVDTFDKTSMYLKQPLRSYVEVFVASCRHGKSLTKSLDALCDKIPNKHLRQMIINLKVCSEYTENYTVILDRYRSIFSFYTKQRAKRKAKVRAGRISIVSSLVVSVFLFNMVEELAPNTRDVLLHTIPGNGLLLLGLGILVFIVYNLITLDVIK